jgi:hypothetical protein
MKYRDPNDELHTHIKFADMTKEQLIEAITNRPESFIALRCDDDGSFTLIDEVRDEVDYQAMDEADLIEWEKERREEAMEETPKAVNE